MSSGVIKIADKKKGSCVNLNLPMLFIHIYVNSVGFSPYSEKFFTVIKNKTTLAWRIRFFSE
jgi:hypothetical protein